MSHAIVVSYPDVDIARAWVRALASLLPGFEVFADEPQLRRPARFAVAWCVADDFFDRYPALDALLCTGAGVDPLIRHPGLPATLPLIRLEDAGMAALMAEYCCHEVFRFRTEMAAYERQQAQRIWLERPMRVASQVRVGVLGAGVLGRAVALALRGFGYDVTVFTRGDRPVSALAQAGVAHLYGEPQLPRFLGACDVLILLAPLTPATENLIDAARLALLPRGAWLINVARGALVDDQALMAALDAGHLAGATLDVFRQEPLSADHPFWRYPQVRLTPHISAPTLVQQSAEQVADKIRLTLDGHCVTGLVERGRGY